MRCSPLPQGPPPPAASTDGLLAHYVALRRKLHAPYTNPDKARKTATGRGHDMKKMHILLMGAVMVMATPALADEERNMNYQNDNNRPAAESAATKPVSYDDYAANDDDHGDEQEQTSSPRLGFATTPPQGDPRR